MYLLPLEGKRPSLALPTAWAQAQRSTDPFGSRGRPGKTTVERKLSMVLLPSLPTAPFSLKISEDATQRPTSLPCSHSGHEAFLTHKVGWSILQYKKNILQRRKVDSSSVPAFTGYVVSSKWVATLLMRAAGGNKWHPWCLGGGWNPEGDKKYRASYLLLFSNNPLCFTYYKVAFIS